MRTSLQWAILVAAVGGSSYLSHRYWPSRAEASPAGADGRCAAPPDAGPPPSTWRSQGFRDDERCDRFGDPPGCY
jgi:hypothetical protein